MTFFADLRLDSSAKNHIAAVRCVVACGGAWPRLMPHPLHILRVLSTMLVLSDLSRVLSDGSFEPVAARAESQLPSGTGANSRGKNPQAQASALFKEAQELRKANDARGALLKLEGAYQVLPTPMLLFPIAELHLQLVQPKEGLAAIQRYRQEMVPAEMEPGQQLADADRLEKRLRVQLAYLRPIAPAGARVSVDGKDIGTSPLPDRIAVNPGVHRIASASERDGNTETPIEVRAGQDVTVDLSSRGVAASRGYFPHRLTWAAIGVTTAMLLATTVMGSIVIADARNLDGQCADRLCIGGANQDILELNSQVSTQRTHATAAGAILGLTAIFAVGTSALILFDWQRQKAGRSLLSEHRLGTRFSLLSPVPIITGDGAEFALGGRF